MAITHTVLYASQAEARQRKLRIAAKTNASSLRELLAGTGQLADQLYDNTGTSVRRNNAAAMVSWWQKN